MRRIEDLARVHSEEALQALLDEAKRGKGAPRVAAAVAILDRAWGTPVKRAESGAPGDFNDDADEDQLLAECKELAVKAGVAKVVPIRKKG